MPAIKDQAIALRRLDYSETSQVLLFLTREHGPRRLLAKGIKRSTKKKPAAGIDLLERGLLEFSARSGGDGSLGILMEWQQVNIYLGLRAGLDRLYAAQYAAEVTAGMVEEADPHPELFDALVQLLEGLVEGGEALPSEPEAQARDPGLRPSLALRAPLAPPILSPTLPLLARYQATLLAAVGLWPDLTRCMLCDKPAPPGRAGFFSAEQGGLICRECVKRVAEKCKVNAGVLEALRQGKFDSTLAPGSFDFLDYAITHVLGRRPDLSRFVRNLGA
jgi:DNA repair protein RecO (recombination protein O)